MCDKAAEMSGAKRQLGAWILEPDSQIYFLSASATSAVTHEEKSICVILVGVKLVHS